MGRKRKCYGSGKLVPPMHTDFESNAYLNDKTYIDIYNRMKEICLSLYRYENIPIGMDMRYLEMQLFGLGYVFIFQDEITEKFCNLGGTLDYGFDIYGNYTHFTAVSFDGRYRQSLTDENAVIGYNNYTRIPTRMQIELFAWRAWNALRTIDTNLAQQKTSKLLKVPNQRRLTVENILMKVQGNSVYTLVADDLDIENSIADLTVPFCADKVRVEYNAIWNDFLTYVGVVSHNTDKKERESTLEVLGKMGDTEIERNTMLMARHEMCNSVNDMFGQDWHVYFNSDLANFLSENRIETGLENVDIYNNNQEDGRILFKPEQDNFTED